MQVKPVSRPILIVEDMKTNFVVAAKILRSQGYEAIWEADSTRALDRAKEIQPSLILLDFEMPAKDGPTVCRELRACPETKEIPIIFVTSVTKDSEVSRAFDAGADDYVYKPVREMELISRVKRFIANAELRAELQERYQQKAMLTRIVSHDINNLVMLAQWITRAIEKNLDPAKNPNGLSAPLIQQHINKLNSAISRIGDVVHSVRTLQGLEDQKMQVELLPLNLHECLLESVTVFQEQAEKKNLQIHLDCATDLQVMADSRSITSSVFNNLLSNAIKFSQPQGQIEIVARRQNDQIQIEFIDHGIGMPKDLIPRIFLESEKTSRIGTNGEKGTGFGMPIVKKYVELFDGTITVQSISLDEDPARSGTRFTILLNTPEAGLLKKAA